MKLFLSAADSGNSATTWIFVGLLAVLIVLLLVVPMFTNKKRAKQTNDLHNSLQPGDVIKTVGGIIGTVKEIRQISPNEREMVIETGEGDNKTTMVFDINALYQRITRADAPQTTATSSVFEGVSDNNTENISEEKAEDKPIEEKPAETVEQPEEKPAEVAEQPVEEKPAETVEQPEEKPVEEIAEPANEQAASADEKAEKPKAATAAKKPAKSSSASAPKSNGAHKATASKSGTGSKKSTNSNTSSSKK